MAATQGAHHVTYLILPKPPPSERQTSQPYGLRDSNLITLNSTPVCYPLLYAPTNRLSKP